MNRFEELTRRRRELLAETEQKASRDSTTPEVDAFESTRIRARCWKALDIPAQSSADVTLLSRIMLADAPIGEVTRDGKVSTGTTGAAGDKSLNDVPAFFKDLLHKLPTYSGPPPDIDSLLKQLKSTPLPPRSIAPTPVATAPDRKSVV